jgi:uncharacterized protein (DUF427 family)
LYAEPLRRRMRVRFGGKWIADSEHVLLFFEPGRYPVAYFPENDVSPDALQRTEYTTQHHDFGLTSWYTVRAGEQGAARAWHHRLPAYASDLRGRVAFAWPAMEAFYEEENASSAPRIPTTASTSGRLHVIVVQDADQVIADTRRPLALYESGSPRGMCPRRQRVRTETSPEGQTFCPYKGLASYYDIGNHKKAAWSYIHAWPEVARVTNLVSFEPDEIDVYLDTEQLHLEPGQAVTAHGIDRGLDPDEILQKDPTLRVK